MGLNLLLGAVICFFNDRLSIHTYQQKTEVSVLLGHYINNSTVYRAFSNFPSFFYPLFNTERLENTHIWSLWNRHPQKTSFWVLSALQYRRPQCPTIIIIPQWLQNVITIKLPTLHKFTVITNQGLGGVLKRSPEVTRWDNGIRPGHQFTHPHQGVI